MILPSKDKEVSSTITSPSTVDANSTMLIPLSVVDDGKTNNDDPVKPTITTQDVVPQLIEQLYNAKLEVLESSTIASHTLERDPHLRLRRTLTPRCKTSTGIQKYSEAQFLIHPTTGRRTPLQFDALGQTFLMDAYIWGASEDDAIVRVVSLHGISPMASRERWHSLGTRIANDPSLSKKVRFVALDWHSIDRTDTYQEEFLTLLPKHMFTPPPPDVEDEIIALYPNVDDGARCKRFFAHCRENCPRGYDEAAQVLRAIIQQGLGWGTSMKKPFIPCIKSWSGGVGMEMLLQAVDEEVDDGGHAPGVMFKDTIQGAILLHPGCFKREDDIVKAMKAIPTALMGWAKDDDLVPYPLSQRYLAAHDNVKLVTYEYGRHGGFDGSDPKGLNFDDDIITWLKDTYLM